MSRRRTGFNPHMRAYGCPIIKPTIIPTPDIISTDLIIRLDANNTTSYAGSGTTWTNIGTGAPNYNGTLSGPTLPTFVNASPKYFNFTRNLLSSPVDYLNYNFVSVIRPLAIGDDFTFCAWINSTQVGAGLNHYQLMYIVSTETGGLNNDFGFGINSAGKLAYGDGDLFGSDITIATTQSVNTGNWIFVSVTRQKSNGEVKLYINGVLDTTGTCNVGNYLGDSVDMLIGSEKDFPGYTWGGGIGLFLANTSVLTSTQILQNFNATRSIYGI